MIIGVTGIHGCGKTKLSDFFATKGFFKVKNPFTFSSETAREIASCVDKDQISKAFRFLEDRLRCFLDVKTKKKVITDRWWLDVCLNVEIELLPIFFDFYNTEIFLQDFTGIYLDINVGTASKREEIFSYAQNVEEKRKFENAIRILKERDYINNFKFQIIHVENKTPQQLFDEIMSKV